MADFNPSQNAAFGKVIAKSWSDEAYKEKLLSDPRSALADVGVDLPEGVEITIAEQTADNVHIVLPPKPEGGALSAEALQSVSGGFCSCCCSSSAWGN